MGPTPVTTIVSPPGINSAGSEILVDNAEANMHRGY